MRPLPLAGLALRGALLLAAAATACGRPAPAARFLNFDAESSSGALGTGWSAFERTEAGDSFVWAEAREARVEILAGPPADRLVRFRAWPFWWEGAPPQAVTLAVNGVRLGTWPLSAGPRVYGTVAPEAAWREGANVLTFGFAWAEAPRDRIPGADDARTLAAAFDWVEVLPAGGAPGPR